MDEIQDIDANEARDPYYPMIQIGYNFPPLLNLTLSPQIFYVLLTKKELVNSCLSTSLCGVNSFF
jgi:hypothetical protein